jgi:hypothetical protein
VLNGIHPILVDDVAANQRGKDVNLLEKCGRVSADNRLPGRSLADSPGISGKSGLLDEYEVKLVPLEVRHDGSHSSRPQQVVVTDDPNVFACGAFEALKKIRIGTNVVLIPDIVQLRAAEEFLLDDLLSSVCGGVIRDEEPYPRLATNLFAKAIE